MAQLLHFVNNKNCRLDEFLRKELPVHFKGRENPEAGEKLFSNSKIRRLIVAGAVSVNVPTPLTLAMLQFHNLH